MKRIALLFCLMISVPAAAAVCDFDQIKTATMIDQVERLQSLVSVCDFNPNTRLPEGRALMHIASEYNSVNTANWLLSQGADPNATDIFGITPLHSVRSATMASILLTSGAQLNAVDSYGRTPFLAALDLKNWELIEYLRSSGSQIREIDLSWAADYYHLDVLQYLARVAQPNELRGTGRYFRTFFLYDDQYQAVASELISKGADINLAQTISSQRSLLDFYVNEYIDNTQNFQTFGLKAIRFVVEHGADVNGYSPRAGKPIVQVALNRPDFSINAQILDLFLAHGLDLNLANPPAGYKTILMDIASQKFATPEAQAYSVQMLQHLLYLGANPNVQGSDGRTALHWATRWTNAEMAQLLIPVTDMSLVDQNGRNALQFAYARLEEAPSIDEKNAVVSIIRALETAQAF